MIHRGPELRGGREGLSRNPHSLRGDAGGDRPRGSGGTLANGFSTGEPPTTCYGYLEIPEENYMVGRKF
jgi:hypothetical protein